MTALFQLYPGQQTEWHIDSSALSRHDIETLAWLGARLVGPYGTVYGVPRGGLALAKAMEPLVTEGAPPLIVDDVFITNSTMEEALNMSEYHPSSAKGLVIFARGPRPAWVRAIFTLAPDLRRL